MQLLEYGPRLTHQGQAVATLTATPPQDRAWIITDLLVTNPSADDTWVLTVAGRELMRFRVLTVGNQHVLGKVGGYAPPTRSFFGYCRDVLGVDASIPVPQGAVATLASVGGATADVVYIVKEVQPTDTPQGMLNHPLGRHFVLPVFGYVAAAYTAAGAKGIDTSIRPAWVPDIWGVVTPAPVGFQTRVLALFLEGGGVNTFSGAANHQSATASLNGNRNGQTLFSRDGTGLALLGTASAAGSANTVYQADANVFPPFDEQSMMSLSALDTPLPLNGGDNQSFAINVAGDVTGNADYSRFLQVAILDVTEGS